MQVIRARQTFLSLFRMRTPQRSFYKDVYIMGKGKPTKDPFQTPLTPTNLGEDSYFLVSSQKHLTFGVADGVGGWTLDNGQPDLVAQAYMKHCEEVTQEYEHVNLTPGVAAQIIFAQAYERLQANPPGLGSTTALVMSVAPFQGKFLGSVHFVGDSGFTLLKKEGDEGDYIIKQPPSFQRYGETPFQLGSMITKEMEEVGTMNTRPGEGVPWCVMLEKGDLIVAATDGLWDNLSSEQILSICNRVNKETPPDGDGFCKKFTSDMMRAIMMNWRKFDDVTIVAALI